MGALAVNVPDPEVMWFGDPVDSDRPRLEPPAIDRRLARIMRGELTVRRTMLRHERVATMTLRLPEAAAWDHLGP